MGDNTGLLSTKLRTLASSLQGWRATTLQNLSRQAESLERDKRELQQENLELRQQLRARTRDGKG